MKSILGVSLFVIVGIAAAQTPPPAKKPSTPPEKPKTDAKGKTDPKAKPDA